MSLLNETVFRALARTSPGASDSGEGRIYFDSGTNRFLVSENGGAYVDLTTANDVTLDNAYDGGGSGAGRTVTVDAGAIQFNNNAANNTNVLEISKAPAAAQSGAGLTISMGANATGNGITVTNSGSGLAALFDGGSISVPGLGANSERLGSGATTAGVSAVAVGFGATGSGASSTAIGAGATTGGFAGAIALGRDSTNTAANQLMAGSSTQSITSVIFGNGDTNGTPANVTLRTTDSSAAATAGASLTIRSGTGNTTGSGGTLNLQSGSGGDSSGTGGVILVAGGTGGASNGNGGQATVRGGNASGNGNGGSLILAGGVSPSGSGGVVSMRTGASALIERLFVPNDGGLEWVGLAAAPTLSTAGDARIYYNSSDNTLYLSKNGGGYQEIATGGSVTLQNAYDGGSTIAQDATNSVTISNAAAQNHAVLVLTQGTSGEDVITASGGNISLSDGDVLVDPGHGLDTDAAGALELGTSNATTINVGSSNVTAINIEADVTTITGDLTVNGTVTTINTVNLTVTDSLIYGNDGAGSASAGIAWDRQATNDDAIFLWSETNTRFELGQFDTSGGTVTPSSLTTFSNAKLGNLFLAGTAITADAGLTVTATAANLTMAATGANSINLSTNGATRWTVDSAGNLTAGADNTQDVGASGATRPRTVYVGTSVVVGDTVTITSNAISSSTTLAISAANGNPGNAVTINGGSATSGNNAGAAVNLNGGTGSGTAAGGGLNLTAGVGGNTDGTGGALSIAAGTGGASDGAGGLGTIRGGNGAGAGSGGNMVVAGGISGSGTGGSVLIQTGNASLSTRMTVLPTGFVGVSTTPTSRFHAFGSSAFRLQTVTGNTTAGDQTFLVVDASSGAVTITLPTAVGIADRVYYIKKSDASANFVNVATTGGQTIDNSTTFELKIQGEAIMVVSDGANWWKF